MDLSDRKYLMIEFTQPILNGVALRFPDNAKHLAMITDLSWKLEYLNED